MALSEREELELLELEDRERAASRGPKWVPDSGPAIVPKPDTRPWAQRADAALTGASEAAASMVTGTLSGLVGRAIALGGIATGGTGETGVRIAQEGTYQPKTEEGKALLEAIGRTAAATGVEGLGPMAAGAGGARSALLVRPGARQAAGLVGDVMKKDIPDALAAGDMAGVGAAATATNAMRAERAAALPVPIELTKGQLTRDFAQQQFEREVAKNAALGGPLRERFAEQNRNILQNFDAWLDQTGAEAGSLRATGEAVTGAVANKAQMAKAHIRAAYDKARESGAMSEAVDVAPLQKYLADHQAEAINAPLLTSVEAKLNDITSATGKAPFKKTYTATINDLEEVRKMAGRLAGKDATNALFGREVKGVIDAMTEDKGGELYRKARALRARYGEEFENHAVVDRLLSNKPGTQDRAVAYEDVFAHTILNGSLDDVRTIRKTLQTAGPQGQQAWRELQGRTIQHIRDEITQNMQIDQAGNRVISPARLDRVVTELDRDGKLDFIFGKNGAQQIRDVNGIAQDAFTAPPGAVNTSNTTSALINALDTVARRTTGIPFLGSATGYVAGEMKNAKTRQRIRDALEP